MPPTRQTQNSNSNRLIGYHAVLRESRILACVSIIGISLLFSGNTHAQGGVPLVTVVNDQSPLGLSSQFGIPSATAINQTGDFAFIGNGNSGLFFRAAGAASNTLLLQAGDPVPGSPGSLISSFSPFIAMNATKSLLFGVSFSLVDGSRHSRY